MMMDFPLLHTLEVSELVETTDRFGNVRTAPSGWRAVKVAGWAVNRVDEKQGESVMRTIDQLDVYTPEPFAPGVQIKLPDGGVWEVDGNADDYNHGPWWAPGLYVAHAKKTEG